MEFYLIYSLKYTPINPVNNISGKIFTNEQKNTIINFKSNINYKWIKSLPQTLVGNNVQEYFLNKMYCPKVTKISDSIIYYSEFEINGVNFQIMFFEFPSSELITPTILKEDPTINTTIDRHIKALNNITNQDKEIYDYLIDKMMNEISGPHFYDLTNQDFESLLANPLYLYQKGNINWMLRIESESNNYVHLRRHVKFLDGRVYEYETNKFIEDFEELGKININGGLIYDEVGIGKTLQFISLAISNPNIKTLILVPNHLVNHWVSQFKLHLKDGVFTNTNTKIPSWVNIVSYSDFANYNSNYDRIIVDEIHELYSKPDNQSVFRKACEKACKYKWGLTATPFPVDYSIFNLIKFLSSQTIPNNYIEKLEPNIDIYKNFMRRNILQNIKNEVILPELEIIDNIINFTTKEQIIYDAERLANTSANIDVLRKLCCDTILAVEEENPGITFENKNTMIKNYFQKQVDDATKVLDELKTRLENAEKFIKEVYNYELQCNINHYKKEIDNQTKIVNMRSRSLDYLTEQFKEMPMCPVCLEDIEVNSNCAIINIPGCNHIFCKSCIDYIVEAGRVGAGIGILERNECKCPNCRKPFTKADLINVTTTNVVQKYPSKINKLMEIIKSIKGQIIIFSQFEKLIEKLVNILNCENISTCVLNSSVDIDNFRENKYKVIILSSKNNASGLDLSFVNNIIIFEPIIGTYNYLKDIEKQIIGRIYRINQKRKTTVHRLIVANTIEESIYNREV